LFCNALVAGLEREGLQHRVGLDHLVCSTLDCRLRTAGLTFRPRSGSILPSMTLLFIIGVVMFFWGNTFPKGEFDPGLLHRAVLVGLNEELVYRGVLPACLHGRFVVAVFWHFSGVEFVPVFESGACVL
jgi:hypothetical protein